MRWFPFFILAYVAFGIQTGLRGFIDVRGAEPNFVLLAAVFVAVNAQRDAALLGCLLLGLFQDLLSPHAAIGLNSFAFGAIAVCVVSTQEIVYKDHFLTHLTLGLGGGLLYAALVYGHGWLYYVVMHAPLRASRPSGGPLLGGAVYTALVAPLVFGLLRKIKRRFGFRPLRTHGSGRS
jgi:rod shape-determining protein MreD